MTRNDFLNDVTEWWELLDRCSDKGCYICKDIIDSDQLDEYRGPHAGHEREQTEDNHIR